MFKDVGEFCTLLKEEKYKEKKGAHIQKKIFFTRGGKGSRKKSNFLVDSPLRPLDPPFPLGLVVKITITN